MPDMGTAQCEYTDLLIRIYPQDETRQYYAVEARIGDGSHFAGGELRIDHAALQAAELDPEQYGLALFYALFSGPIRRAYDKATGLAEGQTGGRLRIRLWIDPAAPELHALTWERLHHLRQGIASPIAATAEMPFSRYIGLEMPEPDPVVKRPIRMLFAVSNPTDVDRYNLAALDVEQEITNLLDALGSAQQARQMEITVLPGQAGVSKALKSRLVQAGCKVEEGATSLATLIELLTLEGGYHVLHFVGHGRFSRRDGSAALFLEDSSGNAHTVKDEDLVARLQSVQPLPHLIFLAACESAKRDPENANPFVGLAPRLVEAGVPAVVAMQDLVPIVTARELTRGFYRYLLGHGGVDRAMNQARLLLLEESEQDWAIPVLFMRLEKGQLFTADPIRTALSAMIVSDLLNPLPSDNDYIPMEVIHLSGDLKAVDSITLSKEHKPARDTLNTIDDIFRPSPPQDDTNPRATTPKPKVVVLSGDAGMGKSIQLQRIGKVTALGSLEPTDGVTMIPVYIDLEAGGLKPIDSQDALKGVICEALRRFWPGFTAERLEDMLTDAGGPVLRLLVDGSDALPDCRRLRVWRALSGLARRYPRHQIILTYNATYADLDQIDFTDLLIIQPLSQRIIERYLHLQGPVGAELYTTLEETQLFDIAALPWALIKMLQGARRGEFPRSLTHVVGGLVDDAIAEIATDQGMRSRAAQTLYALAWQMQSTLRPSLPIDEAFHTMTEVRGNREYSLETFYQELVRQELLTPVGEESLRFARAIMQSYCCARAIQTREDRDQALDDITATLGRRTRFYWWQDTLLFLFGMVDAPGDLIRKVLYGVALSEGEQILLVARSIQECGPRRVEAQLLSYVVSALLYRLDSTREPRLWRRIEVIQALAQLRHPEAIPYLIGIANQKVRKTEKCELDYEYSSVRLAAVMALRRMALPPFLQVEAVDPRLAELLRFWTNENIEALAQILVDIDSAGEAEGDLQTIAAFALGDLQTGPSIDILIQLFLFPQSSQQTYRNLTTALTLLDPGAVTRRVLLPLLDREAAEREQLDPSTWEAREQWYEHLIYLAGRIHTLDPTIHAFIRGCLYERPDVYLKGLAIQSLGWLYDRECKKPFEDIALGDFSGINLPDWATPRNQQYLQLQAIEALFYIGDGKTLERLHRRPASWTPELENAFYWTSEEILARQNYR